MYVCICSRITDRQVKDAVREGATSLVKLRDTLGVASNCAKCGKFANELIRETLAGGTFEQAPRLIT